jgi:RNA polymerase sigma-70 factor (ECF subfamily)
MNRDNFTKAYDTYADAIFRHCYFRIYDRERAKDIMQETFMKTWEYIERGNKIENLRAFLYRVANNCIIDNARKKKERSLDELQEQGFEPSYDDTRRHQDQLDAHAMLAVVDQLEDKYKEAVLLRYMDDLSPKEIASIIHESENVVSVRVHRGLAQLKKILKH